jgi:hypothetical protein
MLTETVDTPNQVADRQAETFKIEGLDCPDCAVSLEKAITRAGVSGRATTGARWRPLPGGHSYWSPLGPIWLVQRTL